MGNTRLSHVTVTLPICSGVTMGGAIASPPPIGPLIVHNKCDGGKNHCPPPEEGLALLCPPPPQKKKIKKNK